MRKSLQLLLRSSAIALAALAASPGEPVRAQAPPENGETVDIQIFYEALEPYGRWFEHPQYGFVWSPDVDRNWRPYTRGRWVFTEEYGWYWEAEEPWGWAVFHYGRWFLDDDAGWIWVPGTEWAPAWVAWRHSDQQVGWAPLPPEAEWRGGELYFSESYYDSPRYVVAWCFAPIAALTAYSIYRFIHSPSRNYIYLRNTRWVPSHRFVGRRIYNVGLDRTRFERITRRPLNPVRIVTVPRPELLRPNVRVPRQPGVIQTYRPNIRGTPATVPPPRLSEPPRRDWRHGRPGVAQPPFARPGPSSVPSGPSTVPPGTGPRPPIAAPPRQPTPQPPPVAQPPRQPPPQRPPVAGQPLPPPPGSPPSTQPRPAPAFTPPRQPTPPVVQPPRQPPPVAQPPRQPTPPIAAPPRQPTPPAVQPPRQPPPPVAQPPRQPPVAQPPRPQPSGPPPGAGSRPQAAPPQQGDPRRRPPPPEGGSSSQPR